MIFRFAHPWFFLAALLIPLWLWVRLSSRFRSPLNFPAAAVLKSLPVSPARRLHALPSALGAAALLLIIIALARPQTGLRERTVNADTVDIVLAVDTSTSMRAIDFSEDPQEERNRLDVVKDVAETFIKAREGDRIGLVAFAGHPYTLSPPTLDEDWLLGRLRDLDIGDLPDGTAIGSALVSATNRLRESEAESRVIVLLTDGLNTAGDIDPLTAAPLTEELGIRVYTIGAGSGGLVRYPVSGPFGRTRYRRVEIPIDTETLQSIADITGGRFFRARNTDELEEVFAEIDELERTEIEMTEYTLYTEHFMAFVSAGLGLWLAARLLDSGRLGRATA